MITCLGLDFLLTMGIWIIDVLLTEHHRIPIVQFVFLTIIFLKFYIVPCVYPRPARGLIFLILGYRSLILFKHFLPNIIALRLKILHFLLLVYLSLQDNLEYLNHTYLQYHCQFLFFLYLF